MDLQQAMQLSGAWSQIHSRAVPASGNRKAKTTKARVLYAITTRTHPVTRGGNILLSSLGGMKERATVSQEHTSRVPRIRE